MFVRLALSIAAAASFTNLCNAQQVFTDRAAFEAAIGAASVESFEGATATNDNTASTLGFTDFSVSSVPASIGIWNVSASGAQATDGTNYLIAFDIGLNQTTVTFDFLQPIVAVGFDVTDIEDGGPLVFSYPGGMFTVSTSMTSGAQDFFGIIDTAQPFTQFDLVNPIGGDGYGVDLVTFSSGVSVPALGPAENVLFCLALAVAGLFVIGTRRRAGAAR